MIDAAEARKIVVGVGERLIVGMGEPGPTPGAVVDAGQALVERPHLEPAGEQVAEAVVRVRDAVGCDRSGIEPRVELAAEDVVAEVNVAGLGGGEIGARATAPPSASYG